MKKATITKQEFEMLADKMGLPLNEETYEATYNMVQLWMNEGNDVNELMMQPEFDSVFPACITFQQ